MNKSLYLEKLDEQIVQVKTKLSDPKLCDGTADTYTRISGYYRPTSAWNNGKQSEMMSRVEYQFQV
jgi:anaerobic ribonucleoside-triphosphate reductase